MTETLPNFNRSPEVIIPQKELVIAGDRGPCGGVNMAIDTTLQVLELVNGREQIYANNSPVHNDLIMEEFQKKGLVIESDINNIPQESIVLFSAHGTPPSLTQIAEQRRLIVVNTECQYVSKVRKKAEDTISKGEHVIYFGAANHPEPKAILADLPQASTTFVDIHSDSIPEIPQDLRIRVLSQTTLSSSEIQSRKRKIDEEIGYSVPDSIGICYATDNRQRAVREGIFGNPKKQIDRLIVVGSQSSHNSKELRNIGSEILGENYSYLVNSPEDLKEEWFKQANIVGFTSGASVVDRYSEAVIRWFKDRRYEISFLPSTEKVLRFKGPNLIPLVKHLQDKYGS